MITLELQKRIFTSVLLLFSLLLMYINDTFLAFALFIVSFISFVEFNSLIDKIQKSKINKIIFRILSFLYLSIFFIVVFFSVFNQNPSKIIIIFLLSICVATDIGGLFFGKIFKGKKLTKISPNKTISGSLGSFFFSFLIFLVFTYYFNFSLNLKYLILTFIVSLISQIGDLFISLLKRKAKVKDTGNILPGHGGMLDRIDGILFGIPFGVLFLLI